MMRDRIVATIAMLTAGMGLAVMNSVRVAERGTTAVAAESQTTSEQQRLLDAGINPATLNACYRPGTPIEGEQRTDRGGAVEERELSDEEWAEELQRSMEEIRRSVYRQRRLTGRSASPWVA